MMRLTVLVVLVLAMGAGSGSQGSDAIPDWVRRDWEYWTQGTGRWIADNAKYKAENEPFDAYGTEWKWGLGKKSLKGRLFALKEGKEVATIWEFHSYWHPQEKRVVQTQFGGDGTFATGWMRATGEKTTESLERFFGADGSVFQVGHRAELRASEVHMQSFDVSESGEWKARRSYVWKLQSAQP
jgi:hypothetical protein